MTNQQGAPDALRLAAAIEGNAKAPWKREDVADELRRLHLEVTTLQAELAAMRAGGEPVATIYVTPDGAREMDDWGVPLPEGATTLYTHPQPAAQDAERLDWLERAGPTSICLVMDRQHDGEIEVSPDDGPTGYGKTLRAAIDAAIATQQGDSHE